MGFLSPFIFRKFACMSHYTSAITRILTALFLLFLPFTVHAGKGKNTIKIKKEVRAKKVSRIDKMLKSAKGYIGTPYRSAGKSPRGFDCSGFTAWIFKKLNIHLKSSSSAQFTQGKKVHKSNVKPGDLVFFSGSRSGRRIGHVGIVYRVADNGKFDFIHSSRSEGVTISSIDERYYSSRYKGARRLEF